MIAADNMDVEEAADGQEAPAEDFLDTSTQDGNQGNTDTGNLGSNGPGINEPSEHIAQSTEEDQPRDVDGDQSMSNVDHDRPERQETFAGDRNQSHQSDTPAGSDATEARTRAIHHNGGRQEQNVDRKRILGDVLQQWDRHLQAIEAEQASAEMDEVEEGATNEKRDVAFASDNDLTTGQAIRCCNQRRSRSIRSSERSG